MATVETSTTTTTDDSGFTLIELAVTIIIIGVLLAMAFPVLLYVRSRSADKYAMGNARTALIAAKSHLIDAGNWTTVNDAQMTAAEQTLEFHKGAAQYSTGGRVIAYSATAEDMMIAVWSTSGTCFRLHDRVGAATAASKTKEASALCTPAVVPIGETW
jgi:prepilin-type N-terminal cleavage/methylation domain-containing protein